VGRAKLHIFMLQYAHDTLFICENYPKNVVPVKAVLGLFEMLSGLKVNFHKSKLRGIKVNQRLLQQYDAIINCSIMFMPFTYLGIPIGDNPTRGKIRKTLACWKGKNLTCVGRVCLIKSVISTIPLFFLSLFRAPKKIVAEIVKIQRQFLWGWRKEGR